MLELNRVYTSGLLDVKGRYSEYLARKDELLEGRPPIASRCATASAASWSGSRARRRPARARRRPASRRRDGCRRELADLDTRSKADGRRPRLRRHGSADEAPAGRGGRRARATAGGTSSATSTSSSRRACAWACSARTAAARRRCCGCWPAWSRRTRERSSARTTCRSCMFDQQRSRLDPARLPGAHAGAVRRRRRVPRARDPRRGLGQAVPLPLRAARDAGRPPLRRRAGARRDREADAGARRRAAARRAHQRPRHPDAGDPRGEPARLPGRARPGHARPLPARPRVHAAARARRQGRGRPRTPTTRSGRSAGAWRRSSARSPPPPAARSPARPTARPRPTSPAA